MKVRLFLFPCILSFIFISCGEKFFPGERDFREEVNLKVEKTVEKGLIRVHVIDAKTGSPIEDAMVAFDFDGVKSVAYTDVSGLCEMDTPDTCADFVTITAGSSGYRLVTLYRLEPEGYRITIPLLVLQRDFDKVRVRGTFKDWHPMRSNDGIFDFGFFIPVLSPGELLSMNPSIFLGPTMKVDIFGERDIPGNIEIPKQREYIFFTVKKKDFILPMDPNREGVFGLSASAPGKAIAGAFSNGNTLEALKVIRLRKFALNLSFIPDTAYYNFSFDFNLKPGLQYSVKAPADSNVVNVAFLTGEDGRRNALTGFTVVNPYQPSGTLTVPIGIENMLSPLYSVYSVATEKDQPGKKSGMSMIIKRGVLPGESVEFEEYLDYFDLSISDDFDVLSHGFVDDEINGVSISRLVGYKTTDNNDYITTMYWDIYASPSEKEIAIPELPLPYPDVREIVARAAPGESMHFMHTVFDLEGSGFLESFDFNDFLSTVSRLAWGRVRLKLDDR